MYLLTAQYAVKSIQVADDASSVLREIAKRTGTAGSVSNQQVINEIIQKDYTLRNVRGSPVMYDVLG